MSDDNNLCFKKKISLKDNKDINLEDYNLIKNSEFFSKDYYLINYPHVRGKEDPIVHYLLEGYKEGYNPNFNFDTNLYLQSNPEVEKLDINPLIHYLKEGQKGKRYDVAKNVSRFANFKHKVLNKLKYPKLYLLAISKFNYLKYKKIKKEYDIIANSGLFDKNYYNLNYPETKNFSYDPILHYLSIGTKHNYKPNQYFDANYYINTYNVKGNAFADYILNQENREISFEQNIHNKEAYLIIKESGLFNEDYYIKNYPEVTDNPIMHYIYVGSKKGYNPSSKFDTKWYLENYPKVKYDILNPLVHYIKHGKNQGWLPKPLSEDESKVIIEKIDKEARNKTLHEFSDDAPLVSIVILNRNGLDFLKTLFSNFRQTVCYPNYEIIVVDNDSSDKSVNYLEEVAKELPLKIIKNKTNESFSAANNKAVRNSKGEYVVLLNNDMDPIYGWLNHMMYSYLKDNEVGIVGAKLIFPFREGDPTSLTTQNEGIKFMELNNYYDVNDGYVVPYNIKGRNVFEKDREREIGAVLGASLLIKKDLYEELGGLDDNLIYNYEDIDLCFKAIEKGYKVVYNPDAQLYHYYKATRKETFDASPRDIRNQFYLYRKWNKWIAKKLFIDKIKNQQIFADYPAKIAFVSVKDSIKHENDLNYNYYFVKFQSYADKIRLENDTDILISDVYDFNPNDIIKNNLHQVKVAVIRNNVDRWIESKNLSSYDFILVEEEYFKEISNHSQDVFILNDDSIFKQIRELILDIAGKNEVKFNSFIHNPNFVDSIPMAAPYLSIENSEYFDKEWYENRYDVSDYKGDSITHYLKVGGFKGYNPGPNFNSKDYLNANLDVKEAHINPLSHYELYGKEEGRNLTSSFKEYLSYKLYSFLIKKPIFSFTKKLFKVKDNQILFFSPWDREVEGKLNENSQIIYDALDDKKYDRVIHTKKSLSIGDHLKLLKKACTSKVIVMDNGFGLLARINLEDNQKVINIWHACGAFKKIAYDLSYFSEENLKNLDSEFKKYSNFIVSSDDVVPIYANAHGMDEKDVLPLGVPRTDIFFTDEFKQSNLNDLYSHYPKLKDKEIILYAPTFRDNYEFYPDIDWDDLSEKLGKDEIFVIKRHPRMNEDFLNGKTYDNIVYIEDVSLFGLMFASKLMITDYSSTIFEYSLLNKPVIHFCPDFDKYLEMRGFYLDFNNDLYGDIIKYPNDLVDVITNNEYELKIDELDRFKKKYMSSCDGNATGRVVKLIENYMEN